MRLRDKIKISQTNLLRSKLRTFLTISAIFVGTFTISLTNGVGNGLKAYVDSQLGNVGVENVLVVSAKSENGNPFSSDVAEYDPEQTTGIFNQSLISKSDLANISQIAGVEEITPQYMVQVEYVYSGISKKYQAAVEQYIDGLNVEMASGSTIAASDSARVNIPNRYVGPLGLGSAEEALNKSLTIGYKDIDGKIVEKTVAIGGVMQQSLIGGSSIYAGVPVLEEIRNNQTRGVANLAETYFNVFVTFNPDYSDEQIEELKQLFNANDYNAQTMQDAVGLINTVIDGILMVLNVFSAIALIAATFGIVNTLFMAVTERTSEIGLMKALGANRGSIFSIFALESASLGFWGAILGVGVSMGLAPIVNSIARNNFLKDFVGFELLVFPWLPSLTIVAGIIFLAFLAGTLPSIKASRLDPIKALRYE